MSKQYDDFIAALERLCLEHCVQIATSGYDTLQVWPMNDRETEAFHGGDKPQDCTDLRPVGR